MALLHTIQMIYAVPRPLPPGDTATEAKGASRNMRVVLQRVTKKFGSYVLEFSKGPHCPLHAGGASVASAYPTVVRVSTAFFIRARGC